MSVSMMPSPSENFGGNIRLASQVCYVPANEAEVLEVLRRHSGEEIRAVGRLHSWSEALGTTGVLIDLRNLNDVVIHQDGDTLWAEVGAGCQIKRLLAELQKQGLTTLSQGLIKEQTLAGAAATGTHGSGGHSFSHSVHAMRVARYSPDTGEPLIEVIDHGPELRAARCSLGCLGIVTRLHLPVRRAYFVEEHFYRYDSLAEVLAAEEDYPLQQFFLVPWRWDYFAQHRREVTQPRSRTAFLYRIYWAIGMDRLFHQAVIALARWLPAILTRIFYRRVLVLLVPQGWRVVDRSDVQLSMAHELYRHIETELFVTREHLPAALGFLTVFLRHAAGEKVTLDEPTQQSLRTTGLQPLWEQCRGRYVHHYPICIRKILPDETLISMASGSEARYSISLITYAAADRRQEFFAVVEFLTTALARLFGARPHWGKHCPLPPEEVPTLYPHLGEFRRLAEQADPQRRFANAWLKTMILGQER